MLLEKVQEDEVARDTKWQHTLGRPLFKTMQAWSTC